MCGTKTLPPRGESDGSVGYVRPWNTSWRISATAWSLAIPLVCATFQSSSIKPSSRCRCSVNSKLKYILPVCIIPAVVLLLYPHENIVAPALRLLVIDETDNLISGIVVKQEWEYMAIGSITT